MGWNFLILPNRSPKYPMNAPTLAAAFILPVISNSLRICPISQKHHPSYSHSIQHVHHFREMRCLKHTMFFPFRKSPARWFNHQGTKELVDSDLAEESRSLSVDPTVNVWWFFDLLQRWHSMAWHGTVVSCLKNGYSMQQIFSSPLSCINQTSIFDPLQFYCAKKTFQKQYVFVWKLATSKSNGLSSCSLCLTAVFWGVYPHFQTGPKLFFFTISSH